MNAVNKYSLHLKRTLAQLHDDWWMPVV